MKSEHRHAGVEFTRGDHAHQQIKGEQAATGAGENGCRRVYCNNPVKDRSADKRETVQQKNDAA
ncbi:hypothetical protein MJ575_02640 [Klebsiella pneumoniae]|nr:hypothetical protein MJ575_02640 [Klebsiella pneumoniae]